MKYILSFFLLAVFLINAEAANYVTQVGAGGNGRVIITFSAGLNGCSTATRFDLDKNHIALKNVLSVATTALVTGKPVAVLVDGCDANGRGNFSETNVPYIFLQSN